MKTPATLYEDHSIIAVNKPARLLVIPDRFDDSKPDLHSIMQHHHGELFIVHRIDFNTSGIVLFARTAEAHKALSEAFEHGSIKKTYAALTLKPRLSKGEIDAPIRENPSKKGLYEVHPSGKPSRTTYQVEETFGQFALLKVFLHTGRTHQIRVHLNHHGAPLMVDRDYGGSEAFYLSSIKRIRLSKNKIERPLLSRSSLHASEVEFEHPISSEVIRIEAPLAKDMRAVIHQMKKNLS